MSREIFLQIMWYVTCSRHPSKRTHQNCLMPQPFCEYPGARYKTCHVCIMKKYWHISPISESPDWGHYRLWWWQSGTWYQGGNAPTATHGFSGSPSPGASRIKVGHFWFQITAKHHQLMQSLRPYLKWYVSWHLMMLKHNPNLSTS